MKRLHNLVLLLSVLTGCSKAYQVGVQECLVQGGISAPLGESFTISGGHVVSFTEKDGRCVAMVSENLPVGFNHKMELPVRFASDHAVFPDAGSGRWQIHVLSTSKGPMVYMGRMGLQGGGARQSSMRLRGKSSSYHSLQEISDGKTGDASFVQFVTPSGFLNRWESTCTVCTYSCQGSIMDVGHSLQTHYCKTPSCGKCLQIYEAKCGHSRKKGYCKQCCSLKGCKKCLKPHVEVDEIRSTHTDTTLV